MLDASYPGFKGEGKVDSKPAQIRRPGLQTTSFTVKRSHTFTDILQPKPAPDTAWLNQMADGRCRSPLPEPEAYRHRRRQ